MVAKGNTILEVAAKTNMATSDIEKQRFVAIDGSRAGVGAPTLGVTKEAVKNGELGAVVLYGLMPVVAGTAVSAGAIVQSDSEGRAVVVASGYEAGVAVTAAAAAGETILVKLK